jgi:hypothetical protein
MLGDNDDLIEVNDVAPVTESAIRGYTLQRVEEFDAEVGTVRVISTAWKIRADSAALVILELGRRAIARRSSSPGVCLLTLRRTKPLLKPPQTGSTGAVNSIGA